MDFDQAEKNSMESSSSDSSFIHAADDEYDVDYILGKRIRYGGVSISIALEFVACWAKNRENVIAFDRM